jgi:hypothetical protein
MIENENPRRRREEKRGWGLSKKPINRVNINILF